VKAEQIKTTAQLFFTRMLRFMHSLRNEGFSISSGEIITAFRALETLHLLDETEMFLSLRAVLCSTRMERDRFEQLFTAFFQASVHKSELKGAADGKHVNEQEKSEQNMTETAEIVQKADSFGKDLVKQSRQTFSSEGGIEKNTSFLQAVRQSQTASKQYNTISVPSDYYCEMLKAARSLIHSMRLKTSRRWKLHPKGRRIELRRTFRKSLHTGGYAINLAKSNRYKNKARFVLLCDGSRSMAIYTKLFLQFAAALHRETAYTELFLFSTEIRRVTHLLTNASASHMPSLTRLGPEWGGGTSIGHALIHLLQRNGEYLLSKQTVFIIFSDGLESGDLIKLEQGMKLLKQRVNRIVWLNPHLGKAGYEPLAQGMQIALPYIDIFAEAHDVTAFHKLAQHMKKSRENLQPVL